MRPWHNWGNQLIFRGVYIFLITISVAGCLNSTVEQSETNDEEVAPIDQGENLFINSCEGPRITHDWIGPNLEGRPEEPPKGWSKNYGNVHYAITMNIFQCGQFGWGIMEKTDVKLIIEAHTKFGAPSNCASKVPDGSIIKYLYNVWIDDYSLYEYMNSLDVPTQYFSGNIIVDSNSNQAKEFTWGVEGGSKSKIVSKPLVFDSSSILPTTITYYWFNGDMVFQLVTREAPNAPLADLIEAEIYKPALLGDRPSPQAVTGHWSTKTEISGKLTIYSDLNCNRVVFP